MLLFIGGGGGGPGGGGGGGAPLSVGIVVSVVVATSKGIMGTVGSCSLRVSEGAIPSLPKSKSHDSSAISDKFGSVFGKDKVGTGPSVGL